MRTTYFKSGGVGTTLHHFVFCSALLFICTATAVEGEPRDSNEWRLLDKILASYTNGTCSAVRHLQTDTGKKVCDSLAQESWLRVCTLPIPTGISEAKNDLFFFSNPTEHRLHFECNMLGKKCTGRATFFVEGPDNALKFHDIYLDAPVNAFLSAKPDLRKSLPPLLKLRELQEAAHGIAHDPSAWREMLNHLKDYDRLSISLGLSDSPDVVAFRNASQEMAAFSTAWNQQVSSGLKKLLSTSAEVKNSAGLSVSTSNSGFEATASSTSSVEKENADILERKIGTLTIEQSAAFLGPYKRLMESYRNLLKSLPTLD